MTNSELIQELDKIVANLATYENSTSPIYTIAFEKYNGKAYLGIDNTDDPAVAGESIAQWDHDPTPTEILAAFSAWLQEKRQAIEKMQQDVATIALKII